MPNLPQAVDDKPPRKKYGCLKIAILLVLGLAIVLHFTIAGIAKMVANNQLPKQLQTEASLGKIDLTLPLGRLGLHDLVISQPAGFEGDSLLHLKNMVATVPLGKAIKHNPLVIRNVHLDGLSLNLISDTNQVLNVSKLGPPPSDEPVKDDPPAEPMPIWLKKMLVENVQFQFQDQTEKWKFKIQDLKLDLENIQIDYDSGKGPGLIKADLIFPGGKKSGRLKLLAKVGTIPLAKPEQIPTLQLAVGIIGFDLGLIDPFLTPSPTIAKTAFGGSAFDFLLFMNVDAGTDPATRKISGKFELSTNRGTKLGDSLGGTLAKPSLPFTTLFTNILGSQFGRITHLGGNVAKGGMEAGKAVANTGIAAVKGAGKTVSGLADGLFHTAKGVVTLNKDETLGGMKEATVGTVSNLSGTVTDTASTAAKGVGNTAGAVSGVTATGIWWTQVDERTAAFEKTADVWFEAHPFPGSE